ncbi:MULTISPECIES: radical SAM protein [Cysteiniphilum]|uniref:Radical SAM core domain-containing protein n=1 Tax=Cysteiniphilum litorale TaxID=2056700 RepID=A0A8J2Z3A0_9GAMM|nr:MULTISPECIES: radical SAM protein [Cysteiniphilum]GGF92661.1 hypothetical protein GCM10010995_07270 [Cysteiniphilum litorale]
MMLQVRLTNWCNVGCDHCMIPLVNRHNKLRLSNEFYQRIGGLVNTHLKLRNEKTLRLSFTGGEPLTLNHDFLVNAYNSIKRTLDNDTFIEHRINTSLIAYRDEHAAYISDYVDLIKTSLDLSTRKINGSVNNYHQLWLKKYHAVKKLGKPMIVNCTLTKSEIGQEAHLIDTLMSYGIENIQISQFFKTGVPEVQQAEIPSNLEQSNMYCHIFDLVLDAYAKGKYINVDICKSYSRIALHLPMIQEEGCQKGYFVIEPDGKVSTCTIQSAVDKGVGRLNSETPNEILFSPDRLKNIRYQQNSFQSGCLSCEFFKNCNRRVCLHMPQNQEECMGYKVFLEHIKHRCTDLKFKSVLLSYLHQSRKSAYSTS